MSAYTKQQIAECLVRWNAAAAQLPNPEDGLKVIRDGLRFSCYQHIDGATGAAGLTWELMSSNWRPTGIVWRKPSGLPTITHPCLRCGGEGQIRCRPSLSGRGEVYTVDCEDCDNSTLFEHANEADAIASWEHENKPPEVRPLVPDARPLPEMLSARARMEKIAEHYMLSALPPIDAIASQVARLLATKKDTIIHYAVIARAGEWVSPDDCVGRLEARAGWSASVCIERWYLDGELLLEWHGVSTEWDGSRVTWTMTWR